jgi:phytoene dehydrogenase-like protein
MEPDYFVISCDFTKKGCEEGVENTYCTGAWGRKGAAVCLMPGRRLDGGKPQLFQS